MSKRTIKLKGTDKELKLTKVSMVKFEHSKSEFIYLEKIKGTEDEWRLTYTEKTIPEIKELTAMEIIRDE